ncbi:MAG: hypothetical protein IT449_03125 [Phycisphaerales bacterium]|nr:hypothetical protein [Phycisphaerales bacterium]
MKRCVGLGLIVCMAWMGAATAQAASVPENFTLGKFVPGNAWMYIHHVDNAERAFIEKEWGEVFDAFHKSGILNDVKNFALSNMPSEEDRKKATEVLDTVIKLVEGVEWEKLAAKEFAFAERLAPPLPEYIFLFRGADGSGEKNFQGLLEILKTIASLKADLQLKQAEGNVNQWSLALPIPMPYSIELFRDGEVIGMVLGSTAGQQVRDLMAGKGSGAMSMMDNPRFREAMMQVPNPEDGMEFFDAKMLIDNVFGLAQMGMKDAQGEEVEKIRGVVTKIRGMVDFVDYSLTTHETDGLRELGHGVCRIQAEKKDSAICKAITQRKAFETFDKYVPADATGFSVNTGIDFGLLYHTIVDFVEKEVPEGAAAISTMRTSMQDFGFDPDRDIFSWLSGEMMMVSLPSAMASPMGMGGGDGALMIRVSDAAKAKDRLAAGIERIKQMLPPDVQGQVNIGPATGVSGEGFYAVNIPQMAMMGIAPVFGVSGEWLCIGSSAAGLNKCLATATGDAPSIRTNERFAKEGLLPKGPVVSASFADTSKMGQELGMAFGSLGMLAMLMPGEEAKPARDFLTIITKLGPVLAKLDFYSSESSVVTFDGTTWKTEKVVTYKDPKATPPATESKPAGGSGIP